MKLLQSFHNPILEQQNKPSESDEIKINGTTRQDVNEKLNLREKGKIFDTIVEYSIRGYDMSIYLLANQKVSDPGNTYHPLVAVSRETILKPDEQFSNAFVFNHEIDGKGPIISQISLNYSC